METGQNGRLPAQQCVTCGEYFTPYVSSQVACSRRCRDRQPEKVAQQREWNARPENRERKNAARRGTEKTRKANQESNLKRRYGLTSEQYEQMLTDQEGKCAICGSPPDPNGIRAQSRLHVDHDHESGRVRGLLCGRCNPGIGYLRHDIDLLRAAIRYLEST